MHLFVDEADRFVPQRSPRGDQRMLGAFEAIVRRGGLRGLGTTLISQRAAVVNKNVLEQLDLLVVLRTVGPNDRKAIEAYVSAHGTDVQLAELVGSLPSLGLGEAWLWEPGAEPPLYERVQIRERRTFNSSATPKPGERRVEPRRLADVDLDAVKEAMAATIERADAEDPKKLGVRIRELERDLARARAQQTAATPDVERVEVSVFDPELVARIEAVTGEIKAVGAELVALAGIVVQRLDAVDHGPASAVASAALKPERRPRPKALSVVDGDVHLKAGARRILEILARHHPMKVTRAQVGTLTGFKASGGTFGTYLSTLSSATYPAR